jgi:hypothetical protein
LVNVKFSVERRDRAFGSPVMLDDAVDSLLHTRRGWGLGVGVRGLGTRVCTPVMFNDEVDALDVSE